MARLDQNAREQIAKLREQQKAEKQAQKDAKKRARAERKENGRGGQIREIFRMTREAKPALPWIMLGIVLGSGALGFGIGWLLKNWITFLIIGLVVGLMLAMLYMSRSGEKVAFQKIEGRPGAAGAAMSILRRGWILKEEPVAVSPRTQDLVFMAIGRPGIVLVTEGPNGRVRSLVEGVRRDVERAVRGVPVTIVNAGSGKNQTPLPEVSKTMKSLPKAISRQEVRAVDQRLSTLRLSKPPIPKGMDPNRPPRMSRRALRGN